MTIWNLGSINIDRIYTVPHLPARGETLAAVSLSNEIGGKGANQSVAAARAGSQVFHIGAIGQDDRWLLEELIKDTINVEHVYREDAETGHAIIAVDQDGENSIILYAGANHRIRRADVASALQNSTAGDIFLLQNETSETKWAAVKAKTAGLHVIYSAAPFDADVARDILGYCDTLMLNEIEISQLETALNAKRGELEVDCIVITKGGDGIEVWEGGVHVFDLPAFPAEVVDTTGAGDCFAGYFAASRDQGLDIRTSAERAVAAASLQVEKPGTAAAIPGLDAVIERISKALA